MGAARGVKERRHNCSGAIHCCACVLWCSEFRELRDRKSTCLNSSHLQISYAVFCLKKKKNKEPSSPPNTLTAPGPGDATSVRVATRPVQAEPHLPSPFCMSLPAFTSLPTSLAARIS